MQKNLCQMKIEFLNNASDMFILNTGIEPRWNSRIEPSCLQVLAIAETAKLHSVNVC